VTNTGSTYTCGCRPGDTACSRSTGRDDRLVIGGIENVGCMAGPRRRIRGAFGPSSFSVLHLICNSIGENTVGECLRPL